MEDLTFTHTVTVTKDDFITMEFYLNLNELLERFDFEESLDAAFHEVLDDFVYCDDYVRQAIWGYHKEEILEKFKEWHKNS